MLTQARLKQLFCYNPETGLFTRNESFRGVRRRKVGYIRGAGYIALKVDYDIYLAHRLAWLYMTGEMPKQIDHIDCDRQNNKFSNLRLADVSQNQCNSLIKIHNKSGYKGVSYVKSRNHYRASIKKDGKSYNLGDYDTAEEAAAAYAKAAPFYHGEYARLR